MNRWNFLHLQMPSFTDQLGRSITLKDKPQRIVSLVPSQTELLFDLGLDDTVAGITKFCIHPTHWHTGKTRIGGTKTVKMDIVQQLQPDLIIANKEENVKEQVEELSHLCPTWISDINCLDHALHMIRSIGEITGTDTKATHLINTIQTGFSGLRTPDSQFPTSNSRLRTAYLIWRDPYMTTGGDTFINDMLNRCGLQNIFETKQRYPVITVDELKSSRCELLLLSSEPYPFKEKHIIELQEQLPGVTILLVDGEMFSWYGSRLQQAPAYFKKLLEEVKG